MHSAGINFNNMWHNVLFVFLAGTLLALIDCMYIVTSRIFNLVVLGIFVSFYCFTALILCLCANVAYGLQELNKLTLNLLLKISNCLTNQKVS